MGLPSETPVTKAQIQGWIRLATVAIVLATVTACKHHRQSNGEVSRRWTPPVQEQYLGVPAADAQAAILARLAAKPSAPLGDDEWKHVKKLYSTFNQNLLWLSDKGAHHERVSALLNALANAD